jgi:hypothetical protein
VHSVGPHVRLLASIIDGVSTLIGVLIGWLLLGAILSMFIGPGAFGLSAMFMAVFWIFPNYPSSCSCEDEPYEREYADQERGEGLRLADRQRVERREPVAAVPSFSPPRHDEFDASYRDAQTAAWSRAVQHHVPSIPLTATPIRARRRRVRTG